MFIERSSGGGGIVHKTQLYIPDNKGKYIRIVSWSYKEETLSSKYGIWNKLEVLICLYYFDILNFNCILMLLTDTSKVCVNCVNIDRQNQEKVATEQHNYPSFQEIPPEFR